MTFDRRQAEEIHRRLDGLVHFLKHDLGVLDEAIEAFRSVLDDNSRQAGYIEHHERRLAELTQETS